MSVDAPIQGLYPARDLLFCMIVSGDSTNSARFCPLGYSSGTPFSGTESLCQGTIPFAFIVRSIYARMEGNAKSANTVITFRAGGATPTGCSVTIAAGVTTEQSSLNINTVIAAGTKCNFGIDTSASASGASGPIVIIVEITPLVS